MTHHHSQHHNHSHASHHEGKKGLKRWQKNLIHGALLIGIAGSLYLEGGKFADLLFFALSVVTEVS